MIAPNPVTESDDYDAQMMARVADGEAELFDELVRRNEARVRGLVLHMSGAISETEDLTQQVFFQAYRGRKSYSPTAKFTTWLYVITRNVVLNEQRRAARRYEMELSSPELLEADRRREVQLEAWYHPVGRLIRQETRQAVMEAIEKLPDRQRQAIKLVGIGACQYQVAAEEMGISEKAIKSLVHRAKLSLRAMLEKKI